MEPQTKKQQKNRDKGTMEYKRAGKGARAIMNNQMRGLKNVKR
jgi:hypothetical protein